MQRCLESSADNHIQIYLITQFIKVPRLRKLILPRPNKEYGKFKNSYHNQVIGVHTHDMAVLLTTDYEF
jgi:hypothetical protein